MASDDDIRYGPASHEGKPRLWCNGFCKTRRLANDDGKCSVCGGSLDLDKRLND